MVFSPLQLAGEFLARTLNDEPVDKSVISHLLYVHGRCRMMR
nr:hypothetical protein [Burkholderia pyrrocinia]